MIFVPRREFRVSLHLLIEYSLAIFVRTMTKYHSYLIRAMTTKMLSWDYQDTQDHKTLKPDKTLLLPWRALNVSDQSQIPSISVPKTSISLLIVLWVLLTLLKYLLRVKEIWKIHPPIWVYFVWHVKQVISQLTRNSLNTIMYTNVIRSKIVPKKEKISMNVKDAKLGTLLDILIIQY